MVRMEEFGRKIRTGTIITHLKAKLMGHKCFISFKMEDEVYKKHIQEMDIDMIDKSLDVKIDSDDPNYVIRKIREDYLAKSTVTIHLIGSKSAENLGTTEQEFIKRELQASLYSGGDHKKSGILGVVLPSVQNIVYAGDYTCSCGSLCNSVKINDTTVVTEFASNYYIPKEGKCHWSEEERYCVLVSWADFKLNPNKYIDKAFEKRSSLIANDIKVYPK